ncbi:50S ribosomal protein L11 methyltransferase [Arcticibacter sp.]|uniref:50S ribosomal protein L11 methyltransferase n=1 Tax=Arcticibacter sp. TaxID=1872630 RepID=UPI00388F79C6
MNYYEFVFKIEQGEEVYRDLLIHSLGEAGFDTFEETESGFNAYLSENLAEGLELEELLSSFRDMITFSYEKNFVPQKNWNEVWESNFEPLTIGNQCYVRATFHEPRPEFPVEIVIDPKMSFGTGHHQTTSMVMEFILTMDFIGKSVLDMGCGTAILAILAGKRGARDITAIDYDPVCFESTLENIALNDVSYIKALCGSKEVIPDATYDVIFANINRNILLDQIESYAEVLNTGGILILSGFYDEDCEVLLQKAREFSIQFSEKHLSDNWASLKLVKA